MKRTLPSTLTEEELLETLNSKTDEREVISTSNNKILSFLSFFNIEPGKHPVPKRALFKLYKKWSRDSKTRTYGFGKEMGNYLLSYNGLYYLINMTSLEIGNKTYKLIEEHTQDKVKSPKYKDHFESFLKYYNIKSGTYYIEGFLLFWLYDEWIYNINKKKISSIGNKQLNNFLSLYFKHKRKAAVEMQWFAVDESILEHFGSEDRLFRIRQAYNERKKEKHKKQRKISSPKTRTKSKD